MAVLVFAPTPYQHALARRLTREIPEIEFFFLYTDEAPDQQWALSMPEDIASVHFQTGCPPVAEAGLLDHPKFYRRGGLIIDWMKRADVRAFVCYGYNDLGRLRAIRWCGRNNVPCFVASDANVRMDMLGRGLKQWLKRLRFRYFLPSVRGVLVFGRPGAEFFARYGVPHERAYFVPYEPDYDALGAGGAAKVEEVRARFGLDPARRRFVFCGRLIPFKRPDVTIDAFVKIADQRPEWDLVVIGDGPLREGVQARVPGPLRDRVRWLGFLSDAQTIGAVYRACEVLVISSDIDAWALVLNEAAASGLAIVSTDIPGAAQHLVKQEDANSGGNGQVVPRGDAAALASAMLKVSDAGLVDRLRANSGPLLAAYRQEADPVNGMRRALTEAGVLGTRR